MSNPEKQSGGVLVSLLRACPSCDAPVRASADQCPSCELPRPGSGWVPVDGGISSQPHDELADDPDTATSAPPPVVPVDATPATRPPVPPRSKAPPGPVGIYVRFFGIFIGSTLLTALLVVLVGWSFLPEPSVQSMSPVPVEPTAMTLPETPAVQVLEPVVAVEDDETDAGVEPAPNQAAPNQAAPIQAAPTQPQPAPTASVATNPVAPSSAPPEPEVIAPPEPTVEPDTDARVVAPEPTAPPAARALDGTYIGRADGDPISMELSFLRDQQLRAVLRVAGRDGTEVHQVRGTYTLAPDGSADFALTDRTDDGVIGYSGSVSGSEARGVVTSDGRRRGRFTVGR